VPFALTWAPSHEPAPDAVDGLQAVDDSQRFWEEWIAPCRYRGEWSDPVRRSLITLKALAYAPTGDIAAAATT
jgi:GH15 family glucan-1,4-alpha-glucosidase